MTKTEKMPLPTGGRGCGHNLGLHGKEYAAMYTKEQEERALEEFEKLGSVSAVIHRLGYPSSSTLYRWYEHKKAGIKNRHGSEKFHPVEEVQNRDAPAHYRNPSAEFKYEAIHRCFELEEDV